MVNVVHRASILLLLQCMAGGAVARPGHHVADFMSLVLDARKPINSFAKLLVERHRGETTERALRKRAAEELYELPGTATPYGMVSEKSKIIGTAGTVEWQHLNIFAFFHLLAAESGCFFQLMKSCVQAAAGGRLGLSLYSDEVVPRNKLRPDMGGKYQAVYFQVLDFPSFLLNRLPLRWFTFGYVSCRELDEAGVTVGQLFRCVLTSWFGPHWNLQHTGVKLRHGADVVHMYAKYVASPQDERAHKFGFALKSSNGSNPCGSCENCMGRVPFFEDESGFAHVLSTRYDKFRPRTEASVNELLGRLADTAAHGSNQDLKDLEQASGIIFEKEGLLFDAALRPYVSFPSCIYWDWMHNWCSSGGVCQFHISQFVLVIIAALRIELQDLDVFARKVAFPKNTSRLSKWFFKDRVISGDGRHIRAFAAEILNAVDILAMFTQLVLKPTKCLEKHVECFEAMQQLFAIYKRGVLEDIPIARELTHKHHVLYMELYTGCEKPKLHYCMHVNDCWEKHGILLSCFSAESHHRFSKDIFSFSYSKPCSTALAFDVRRLFQAAMYVNTFAPFLLVGGVATWGGDFVVDLDVVGLCKIVGSSPGLAGPYGRYSKGDLVEWRGKRLGFCLCFFEVQVACGARLFAAVVDELRHTGAGVWASSHRVVVNATLLLATIPFVQEDGVVRPLYIGV